MIAVARRPGPVPPIRSRPAEPTQSSGKAPVRKQALQPAGQRTGSGSGSVLPYLSLPR